MKKGQTIGTMFHYICFKEFDSPHKIHGQLAKVRKSYYDSEQSVKQAIVDYSEGQEAKYNYSVSKFGFKWRKRIGNKVLEYSRPDPMGYAIFIQDENEVPVQKIVLDQDMNWLVSYYYEDSSGEPNLKYKVEPNLADNSLSLSEYNGDSISTSVFYPRPYNAGSIEQSMLNDKVGEPILLASTSEGDFGFYSKEDAIIVDQQIKSMHPEALNSLFELEGEEQAYIPQTEYIAGDGQFSVNEEGFDDDETYDDIPEPASILSHEEHRKLAAIDPKNDVMITSEANAVEEIALVEAARDAIALEMDANKPTVFKQVRDSVEKAEAAIGIDAEDDEAKENEEIDVNARVLDMRNNTEAYEGDFGASNHAENAHQDTSSSENEVGGGAFEETFGKGNKITINGDVIISPMDEDEEDDDDVFTFSTLNDKKKKKNDGYVPATDVEDEDTSVNDTFSEVSADDIAKGSEQYLDDEEEEKPFEIDEEAKRIIEELNKQSSQEQALESIEESAKEEEIAEEAAEEALVEEEIEPEAQEETAEAVEDKLAEETSEEKVDSTDVNDALLEATKLANEMMKNQAAEANKAAAVAPAPAQPPIIINLSMPANMPNMPAPAQIPAPAPVPANIPTSEQISELIEQLADNKAQVVASEQKNAVTNEELLEAIKSIENGELEDKEEEVVLPEIESPVAVAPEALVEEEVAKEAVAEVVQEEITETTKETPVEEVAQAEKVIEETAEAIEPEIEETVEDVAQDEAFDKIAESFEPETEEVEEIAEAIDETAVSEPEMVYDEEKPVEAETAILEAETAETEAEIEQETAEIASEIEEKAAAPAMLEPEETKPKPELVASPMKEEDKLEPNVPLTTYNAEQDTVYRNAEQERMKLENERLKLELETIKKKMMDEALAEEAERKAQEEALAKAEAEAKAAEEARKQAEDEARAAEEALKLAEEEARKLEEKEAIVASTKIPETKSILEEAVDRMPSYDTNMGEDKNVTLLEQSRPINIPKSPYQEDRENAFTPAAMVLDDIAVKNRQKRGITTKDNPMSNILSDMAKRSRRTRNDKFSAANIQKAKDLITERQSIKKQRSSVYAPIPKKQLADIRLGGDQRKNVVVPTAEREIRLINEVKPIRQASAPAYAPPTVTESVPMATTSAVSETDTFVLSDDSLKKN